MTITKRYRIRGHAGQTSLNAQLHSSKTITLQNYFFYYLRQILICSIPVCLNPVYTVSFYFLFVVVFHKLVPSHQTDFVAYKLWFEKRASMRK